MGVTYLLKKGLYYLANKPMYVNEKELARMLPSIPGWLERGHIYCFDYAIKNLPDDKPILEIGTFAGLSTNVILYYLNKYNKKNLLLTTDWFLKDISPDEKIATLDNPQDLSNYIKESFVRNVNFFNKSANIKSSDLPSDDFFKAWFEGKEIDNLFGGKFIPSGEISFAYIDGNHVYEYAKRDFENVDKILIKEGFILFDDSADYTNWGSKRVAQEAVKSGKYKVIKKNPHYFVQKIS
ncbi:MAG: class I SAM-dependent methyltransferase [Bacteroidales bacterium]|jgi:hypothetical protein|nr:class I SAM-dependent methyltransferase [Bacteroidales bacterium]